ncbi:quaternary amine ABC transporter ATP-binding protein [Mangrovibrevibacter kandeliae]|uniref:quaternary amine ABC transporter ATP-binding protein n=1 Tax=Mangrovibrevibacter kandeliae TaxID=2968473 RepID=UPI00211832D2|nr:glycine betaine/L-proline ABC transporter ATP-binding protein [Aurantimonas sp. CSK15Z-1]MCQ8780768.1 glycine betaine/L-proline ABC transporter ATP-binding protein [Aurantimonas sp. CSK15Z-1]
MTKERVVVRDVVKIFGSQDKEAAALLRDGVPRNEVIERTGGVIGLGGASFSVEEGEILVVMGLSGSGKSTMLRCINRLIEPTAGSITVDGTEVTTLTPKQLLQFRREKFGMVFQHFALFPNRTIAENVEYGLEVQKVDKAKRRQKALEAIELVGLKGWDAKYPRQLSGGMQQRAGLARALAVDADILLMDEAFSALDPLIRRDMQNELGTLQRNLKKTIVFVSHDLDEAIHLGGRIVLMKDGLIVQTGYPEEILLNPADDYVRRFVENIDVSSVITLGRLASRRSPALPRHKSVGDLREAVAAAEDPILVVTCEHNRPVGCVSREAVLAAKPDAEIASLIEAEIPTADGSKVLKSALRKLSAHPAGLAVTDADGRYVGTVTQDMALAALTGTSAELDAAAQSERENAWTGASPNSHWTTSATTPSPGSPSTSPH